MIEPARPRCSASIDLSLSAPCGMTESHQRSCKCGAVYGRTESMAPSRQISSFECSVCDATLEIWNTAWVPTFRLIAGPVRDPEPMEPAAGASPSRNGH
jgi:hypothetical protein